MAFHFVQNGKVVLVHSFVASQGFRFLLLSVFKWLLLFCSEGYFPASGYRFRGSGNFNYIGLYGYVWSSSSKGNAAIEGAYLLFWVDEVSPLGTPYRGGTFPVRCVQELACVLYRSVIKARSVVELLIHSSVAYKFRQSTNYLLANTFYSITKFLILCTICFQMIVFCFAVRVTSPPRGYVRQQTV